jgi:ATP synthase subunit 6
MFVISPMEQFINVFLIFSDLYIWNYLEIYNSILTQFFYILYVYFIVNFFYYSVLSDDMFNEILVNFDDNLHYIFINNFMGSFDCDLLMLNNYSVFFYLYSSYTYFFNLTKIMILYIVIYLFLVNNFFLQHKLKGFGFFEFFITIYLVIYNLIYTIFLVKIQKKDVFYLFFFLFFFILFNNILGLIPYIYVFTAQFNFTFWLSLSFFLGLNFIGFYSYGIKLLNLVYPVGISLVIASFLILIETISYIARVFSLSIRLFANISSGHILLKILSNFVFSLSKNIFLISLLGFSVITILWGLEFFISMLQAYVFLILICIYLNDIITLH